MIPKPTPFTQQLCSIVPSVTPAPLVLPAPSAARARAAVPAHRAAMNPALPSSHCRAVPPPPHLDWLRHLFSHCKPVSS